MVKIDNPAARLHNFITLTQVDKNSSSTCRSILKANLYLSPKAHDYEIYHALAGLLSLPAQITTILDENFPGKVWKHWLTQIETAFSRIDLNGPWVNVIKTIDSRSMTELEMISTLFETKGHIALLDMTQMEKFREKINELKNDIITADLSAGMRKMILHYLNKILNAIESYEITGVEPIMEAIDATIGRAATNEDYRAALKETGIGKKLGEFIGVVANTVTIAQGIPFVTTPLLKLFDYCVN